MGGKLGVTILGTGDVSGDMSGLSAEPAPRCAPSSAATAQASAKARQFGLTTAAPTRNSTICCDRMTSTSCPFVRRITCVEQGVSRRPAST